MISFVYNNSFELEMFINKNFLINENINIKMLLPQNYTMKYEIIKIINNNLLNCNINIDEIQSLSANCVIIFDRLQNENERLKKELLEARKMALLGDMLANISHQWRQPLSIITSSASAMILHKELNILDDEAFDKFSNNIISQGQFLAETIDVFRRYIKKDNVVSEIILQDEIIKILKLVHAVLKENNISVVNNIDLKDKVTLSLIIGELSQVIINIINNAKDVFIQRKIESREIIFDLKVIEDKCIFCIEDNAGGINESIINKVFNSDFTTKERNGTGLGLHMSYEIVTEHLNGDLYVKNTSNGAKFIIEIPL